MSKWEKRAVMIAASVLVACVAGLAARERFVWMIPLMWVVAAVVGWCGRSWEMNSK